MSKPNFDTMSKAELRAYVIAHQNNQEAFYALADRLTAKPPTATYPPSMTPEEIQKAILDIIQQKERSPFTVPTPSGIVNTPPLSHNQSGTINLHARGA